MSIRNTTPTLQCILGYVLLCFKSSKLCTICSSIIAYIACSSIVPFVTPAPLSIDSGTSDSQTCQPCVKQWSVARHKAVHKHSLFEIFWYISTVFQLLNRMGFIQYGWRKCVMSTYEYLPSKSIKNPQYTDCLTYSWIKAHQYMSLTN